METFTLGVALFTLIVISLVTFIIFAKSKLVATGDVNITICTIIRIEPGI